MNAVVFTGHDAPGFLGVVFHQHPVDGLQGKHVDDRRADALLLKLPRRLKGFCNHDAVGNQRNIAPLAQHVTFSNGEGGARRIHARRLLTNGPHPVEAVEIDKLAQHVLKHHRVGHLQHHRMRQPAHNAHILKRHVRSAVVAGRHARV